MLRRHRRENDGYHLDADRDTICSELPAFPRRCRSLRIVMAYRVLLLAALLLGTAAPAMAATVAIAWDPSPEATLIGYRVFVGMSAGRPTASINVGPFQTSFVYTGAVAGQRYYFAVATLVQGTTSAKSQEVSAVAQEPDHPAEASVPAPISAAGAGLHAQPTRDSVVSPQHSGPEALGAVTEIASGLGDITAMTVMPIGGGLLVEHGASLRTFSDQGVGAPAYQARAGTRIAALSVDPHFATTGRLPRRDTARPRWRRGFGGASPAPGRGAWGISDHCFRGSPGGRDGCRACHHQRRGRHPGPRTACDAVSPGRRSGSTVADDARDHRGRWDAGHRVGQSEPGRLARRDRYSTRSDGVVRAPG